MTRSLGRTEDSLVVGKDTTVVLLDDGVSHLVFTLCLRPRGLAATTE